MAHFTLALVTSADGYIGTAHDHSPADWASPEEQALFFRDVEAADWCVMGRHTHEAADRPERRRIVFSSAAGGWRRATQLWLDPAALAPDDLARAVAEVRPLHHGLILGGTRVHDWFHDHGAIDRIHLTVEPVRFGAGLPVFSGTEGTEPVSLLTSRGYHVRDETRLNDAGTRYLVLEP